MKNHIIFLLLIGIFLVSCEKESEEQLEITEISSRAERTEQSEQIIFNVTSQTPRYRTDVDIRTVLGPARVNPFTVENVASAHNTLYGSSLQKMETTNLYIKFLPTNIEHAKSLEETDVFYLDHPFEQEVIEEGDYYQELEGEQFPVLYAVVASDFEFPNVPYEILSELYLDKSDELLIAESFWQTNNLADINEYALKGGLTKVQVDGYNEEVIAKLIIPERPEEDCPPGYGWKLIIDDSQVGPGGKAAYIWDCVRITNTGGSTGGGNPNTNDCGCEVYSHKRKPGGCIKVEDTQLSGSNTNSWEPVRRVKVITKDNWFTVDKTWTDDNGCWKINNKYYGKAWMWVRIKNDRCKIRGAKKGIVVLWQWAQSVRHYVGVLHGPRFNNISTNYGMYSEQGSKQHIMWGASTVNNAVHEFHDYAPTDGINSPPMGLDMYVGRNHSYGYALMSAQGFFAQATGVAIAAVTWWAGPFQPLLAFGGALFVYAYLPDVYVGIDFQNSDRVKSLAFHELAHASHYTQAGEEFWGSLVSAETFANGHGNANSSNAGIIALSESWANHIGKTYADRNYGNNVSFSFHSSFSVWLESERNESLNHVPKGYYNDLVDGDHNTESVCDGYWADGNCGILLDNVSGFTNSQMFSLLTPFVRTPDEFTDKLIQDYLSNTSNTETQVRDLFNSY